MSSMSEDIQCAGSDTRPPMLDRTDFESWQQRIRLYCLGKDNGENIMKSINEGPFHMGTVSDVIAGGTEGAVQQGPVRARVLNDLSAEEKERYKADIRATNILLQGIPKDIYSLINHYTDAKDIWENVKMILEGSELTKDDRESQLYDEFEHFRQIKGETIQGYYVRFTKLINDMRNIKMTMPRMQLNSKFVNNMLPEWSRFITEVKLNRGLKESNFDQLYAYLKQHEVHANENRTMMERFLQPTNDPLALVSNASVQQYPTQSSKSPQSSNEPSPADNFQLDSGSSSTENLIESLSNSLSLLTQLYKSYLPQTNNQLRTSSNARNKATVQDGRVVVQDVRGRYNANNQGRPFQRNNARGNVVAGNVRVLDEEQSLFLAGEHVTNFDDDVDDSPENDLALNVDHIFEADQCDAFDSDVDEDPNVQTMLMVNLSCEDPIYDEAGPSHDSNTQFEVQDHDTFVDHMDEYHEVHEMQNDVQHNYVVNSNAEYMRDSNIILYNQYLEDNEENDVQKVKEMEEIFDQMNNEVDQNDVDKQCADIERKNILIEDENLIAKCLPSQLLYVKEQSRCLDLEAEFSKYKNENQKDVHDKMMKHISKLEREYLNLQLKCQHLQESFENKKSKTSQEAPDFNSFFKIKNLEHQIQEKDNVISDLKVLVSNVNDRSCEPYNDKDVTDLLEQNERLRAEIEKVKQHYKEMFESIKITRTSTNEKTSSLLTQIEDLKAQLEGNLKVATRSSVKTKVLAPGMYAIDVEPIPPRLKNNRSAHLVYINHLKESVETVREIVEEARIVKPLDSALTSACQYTKRSQELVEYVIGTCPKEFTERDNKPRSNTKKNRILPAKTENKKKVEDHPRTNKSVWTKVNRVDSSISSKRVVINSNSESVCKTCNKCLNSASHEICVVNILNSVNATPTVKIVLNKGKQIWKPKGKLSDNNQPFVSGVNSDCSKHMTGNRSKLKNFVEKFIGTVRFGNDHSAIYGYGDYCYEDLGKFQAKADIGIFVGYALSRKGYRIYNKRTRRLIETIHVTFDEMHQTMAPIRMSSGPEPIIITPGQLKSGLAPTDKELEMLFQPMFDDYFEQSRVNEPVPSATTVNAIKVFQKNPLLKTPQSVTPPFLQYSSGS
ncbi:hypothetical protein Tco_0993870 [Tanacetum coccineum]